MCLCWHVQGSENTTDEDSGKKQGDGGAGQANVQGRELREASVQLDAIVTEAPNCGGVDVNIVKYAQVHRTLFTDESNETHGLSAE